MTAEQKTLGQALKSKRELRSLSLRQVGEEIGSSSAYLSQLELGKIKVPSVNVLYKLSSFYQVHFDELLRLAGAFEGVKARKPQETPAVSNSSFSLSSEQLEPEEEEELLNYLKYIRSKKG